jgi:DNA-binding SARP family transcriptional activator
MVLTENFVLRVHSLGTFAYRGDGHWHNGPSFKRGRELLQYLVSYPRTTVSREALADAFWPELDGASFRHRLHLAVTGARAALRDALPEVDGLRCVSGSYTWNPDVHVDSDLDRFLSAFRGGEKSSMETAIGMYGGEYLSGENAEWIYPLRVRCANAYVVMLERLAEMASAEGDHGRALEYALRLVEADRAHEGATRLMMKSLAATGRRCAALAEYEALARYMDKRLGMKPSAQTTAVRDEVIRP